ncbi:MAG: YbjQ family protein [Kiritimatiellaeota bacterium]|nr:YbjQ family protein [Kiritimatiellota bacterium]
MGDLIVFLLRLFVLIPFGFICGRFSEKKHLRSLEERESAISGFLVTDLKTFPKISSTSKTPEMLIGEVTIATDYFKTFAGSLKNFFGGEMRGFESLKTRARREAILRILEQAKAKGFNAVCNLRQETADIGGSTLSKKSAITVSILASATAYSTADGNG